MVAMATSRNTEMLWQFWCTRTRKGLPHCTNNSVLWEIIHVHVYFTLRNYIIAVSRADDWAALPEAF